MRRGVVIAGTAAVVLLVLVGAALAFHDALVAAVIRSVASGMGYSVDFRRLTVGLTAASATGINATNRAGEPVFSADQIDVHYALSSFLPGGRRRRFGITALDVQRPTLTLIHYANGTYNVTLPANAPNAKPDTTPIDMRIRVRDGTVVLLDRFTVPGRERRESFVGFTADAALAPHAHSFYNIRFALDDGGRRYPVVGKATFSSDHGYEAQRWTAPEIPIGPLIDFALPSHAIDVVDGALHDVDGRIYTFVDPDGTTHPFTSLRARLSDGKIYITGLLKPLRNARGTFVAYDDGLTTTALDATLAGVPLHAAGGVYDVHAPKLQFGLTGRGDLSRMQQAIAASQRQPVAGPLAFAVHAVGSLSAPLVSGTFSSPRIVYRRFPISHPSGTFAVHGRDVDLLGVRLAYGPLNVDASGTLTLEKNVGTNLVVGLHGPGDRLPYVSQLVHGLQLNAVTHVSGTGTQLAGSGIVTGSSPTGSLAGIFAIGSNGNGYVGPLSIQRSDGASLYARIAIDRSHQRVLAIADVQHFSLLPAHGTPLPGLPAGALPQAGGTLTAQLVASVDRSRLDGLSGRLRLTGLRYGALTADADVDLGTVSDGTQRGDVHVRSSLGTIVGTAAYAGGLVGFDGRLKSSFARLQSLAGKLGARGDIDGPLLALSDGSTSAVQTPGMRFTNASVAGVPVRDALATATLHGGALDVRALQIGIAGGTVTVLGRLGNGYTLDATTSALDLRALTGNRVPVGAGELRANAHVRGTLAAPRADVALLLEGVRWHGIPASANAFAHYEGGTLRVADATAIAFGSYATAAGTVSGLGGGGTPSLDVTANVHGAQLAPLAAAFRVPVRYPDGELDADLHATGNASAPHIAGTVRVPRGSINGLNFSNGKVAIAGGPSRLVAQGGTVTVGTSTIRFSAAAGGSAQQFSLDAPHLNLADFNGYFNAAETLAGTGALTARVAAGAGALHTSGNLHVADVRYRRFALGNVDGAWNTRARTVVASGVVQSDHGAVALNAVADLPASSPLSDLRHRMTLTADAVMTNLDLARWLPPAGLQLPVTGIGSGAAHLSGSLATPVFTAHAAFEDAVVEGYPLTEFALAATGDAHGARLTALHLAGTGIVADASGTAGYAATSPIAIALHAQSADVAVLAKALGSKLDVGGSLAGTLNLTGSRSAPRVALTLDGTDLRDTKYTLPRLHAELAADPRTLQLRAFEATLQRGRLLATASLPIQLSAPAGLRNAPLSATFTADDVELAQFTNVLPGDPALAGRIDGTLNASGTESDPVLTGTLTLADARYSSKLVRSAITNGRARLDLARQDARLSGLHAEIGGGAVDGNLNATFGDLRDLQRTLGIDGRFEAKNARFDLANLFRGQIDGALSIAKRPGDIPQVAGTIDLSKARLSLAALIPHAPPNPDERPRPTVGFDLNVQIGNDVRVQGPGVDVGARGAIALRGNLARPQLDGSIAATDGTLSFYRTFVLRQATVSFEPADGIVPNVNATATTTITNPDTSILLTVTGPATNLNLQLASSPSYDREQILGLLVGAQNFGAVPGIETSSNGGGAISPESIAGGFLSTEFTQSLLQPVGSSVGQALGFQDLALGYNFGTGLSAGARKQLGKNLSATFNQSFGGDQRQSIAFDYALPHYSALALTLFNAGNQTPSILHTQQLFTPVEPVNYTLQALAPPPGVSGVVFTYQRKY